MILPVGDIEQAAAVYAELLVEAGKRVSSGRHYFDCGRTIPADAPKRTDLSFWDGRLDEIAVLNHALSADQIEELYELGNAP